MIYGSNFGNPGSSQGAAGGGKIESARRGVGLLRPNFYTLHKWTIILPPPAARSPTKQKTSMTVLPTPPSTFALLRMLLWLLQQDLILARSTKTTKTNKKIFYFFLCFIFFILFLVFV